MPARVAAGLTARSDDLGEIWPRQSGVLQKIAQYSAMGAASTFEYYAGLADTFPFEERATPTAGGQFGLLVREPVGVVGAIVPWNAPIGLIANKVAPGTGRGLHGGAQGVTGGARGGLRGGRGG